jgi:hypothetical protein
MPFWNRNRGPNSTVARNDVGVTCPRCNRQVWLSSLACNNCGGAESRDRRTHRGDGSVEPRDWPLLA